MTPAAAYSRLAEVYDEIVVDPCYPQWAKYLHDLWASDSVPIHKVLDVCCGTGLMATELLRLGYTITGTDASSAMLARAKDALGDQVELLQASLPDLGTMQIFDAAISTFDGLNYLNPDDFAVSIQSISDRLRPGGWLCFDLHTDAMLEFTLKNCDISGEEEGYRFTIHSDVDANGRTCDTWIDVTNAGDASQFSEHHRQYFHSDDDVRLAMKAAGFTGIATVEEYSDTQATADTLRATWTARKKAVGMPE